MKRIAWLTDIHLNFLPSHSFNRLYKTIRQSEPDAVFISGDIGEANNVGFFLQLLAANLQRPIYFVLGNHDFYHGSFASVTESVRSVCKKSAYLTWMNDAGIVELTPEVALIGHDSWADGRLGNYVQSDVMLNDYILIEDFRRLNKAQRLLLLNQRGDMAAAHFEAILPQALAQYSQVYVLTHVPPFAEGCTYEGQPTNADFLPHFGCKVVGQTLQRSMVQHPDRQLTVLCGHTHSPAQAQILPNLRVWTAGAEYGDPRVEYVFML